MDPFEIRQAVFHADDPEILLTHIRGIALRHHTRIIFMDADRLAGRSHAEAAARAALRAVAGGTSISHSLEMEALLYAAGSRQCSVAIRFGIHAGANRSFVIMAPPAAEAWKVLGGFLEIVEQDWDRITGEKRRWLTSAFGITPEEVAAAGEDRFRDLVLERVALLEVYR